MGVFSDTELAIRSYVQDNLPAVLTEFNQADFDKYINDCIDLDKYKYNTELFFNFGSYTIAPLTNESGAGAFAFDVFMVFRGGTPEALHEKMLKYADAFYELFVRSGFNFGGAIDGTMEVAADFFNAAEGNVNTKVCTMTFSTTREML